MKTTWIIARIALALIAIFALGIWVGRTTAPAPAGGEEIVLSPLPSESHSESELRALTVRQMKRYQQALGLSREEMKKLYPEFEALSRQIITLPKLSKARLLLIEEFHQRLNENLTEEQKVKATEILDQAREQERE
jgi:hypothetical protein